MTYTNMSCVRQRFRSKQAVTENVLYGAGRLENMDVDVDRKRASERSDASTTNGTISAETGSENRVSMTGLETPRTAVAGSQHVSGGGRQHNHNVDQQSSYADKRPPYFTATNTTAVTSFSTPDHPYSSSRNFDRLTQTSATAQSSSSSSLSMAEVVPSTTAQPTKDRGSAVARLFGTSSTQVDMRSRGRRSLHHSWVRPTSSTVTSHAAAAAAKTADLSSHTHDSSHF